MITATLLRTQMGDAGTFGHLSVGGKNFTTAELPDRGNAPNTSSIPAGAYVCKWSKSPKFGWVYELQDIPGPRTEVLIHSGNWAGDKDKGLRSDVKGCIVIGLNLGMIEGQEAVLSSHAALEQFHTLMEQKDFRLEIVDEYLEAGAPAGNIA